MQPDQEFERQRAIYHLQLLPYARDETERAEFLAECQEALERLLSVEPAARTATRTPPGTGEGSPSPGQAVRNPLIGDRFDSGRAPSSGDARPLVGVNEDTLAEQSRQEVTVLDGQAGARFRVEAGAGVSPADFNRRAHHAGQHPAGCGCQGAGVANTAEPGCWQAVPDEDGQAVRVRWSEPDARNRYLYLRHYPGTAWGLHAAERQATEFNQEGKRPWEFWGWQAAKVAPLDPDPTLTDPQAEANRQAAEADAERLEGRWEPCLADDAPAYRLRWSRPGPDGRYVFAMEGLTFAEAAGRAYRWNEAGTRPAEVVPLDSEPGLTDEPAEEDL